MVCNGGRKKTTGNAAGNGRKSSKTVVVSLEDLDFSAHVKIVVLPVASGELRRTTLYEIIELQNWPCFLYHLPAARD